MLRSHRPVASTPASAAVARARLSQALRADRARIVAASELRSCAPGAEPSEQVLGRLLAEPLVTRSQA